MKKLTIVTLILLLIIPGLFAEIKKDDEKKKKDPTAPTKESEIVRGLISVSGHIGPVLSESDEFDFNSPNIKINFYWNVNKHISVGLSGQVMKYGGPASDVIEQDGQPNPIIGGDITNLRWTESNIEESSYGFTVTFRLFTGGFTPYIYGSLYYTSVTYEQYVTFEYVDVNNDQAFLVWRRFDAFKFLAGGGFAISATPYLDLLLEAEYSQFLDLNSLADTYSVNIGFRFTI